MVFRLLERPRQYRLLAEETRMKQFAVIDIDFPKKYFQLWTPIRWDLMVLGCRPCDKTKNI